MLVITASSNSVLAANLEYYTHPANLAKELPFSEGVRHGETLYLSGQIGIPPGGSQLVPGGIVPESRQAIANLLHVLNHFRLSTADVTKCTVMLTNIDEWPLFNQVYKEFFHKPYPARSAFASNGLAFDAAVEIECQASIPDQTNTMCKQLGSYCTKSSECCANLECGPGSSHAGTLVCRENM